MADETTSQTPERLFSAFDLPSYDEWKAAVEATLKGAPFDKKMLTRTYEGIVLQPMYWPHDIEQLAHVQTMPGSAPFVRSTHTLGFVTQHWRVAQEMAYPTPEQMNEALRLDLGRGQTAVFLRLDQAARQGHDPDQAQADTVGREGLSLATLDDLAQTLAGVDLARTPIFIEAGAAVVPVTALLGAVARQQGVDLSALSGWVVSDPFDMLVRSGTLPVPLEHLYDAMAQATAWAAEHAPNLQTIAVQTDAYHNSGASAVHELAYALATGVAYLRAMQERGVPVDVAAPRIRLSFALGSTLFTEVAKLRAARLLWAQVVAAFGGGEAAQKLTLHARTATWNKTRRDPHVNMLRTTIEAFAGAIGGCDSMHVAPFDTVLRLPDQFSRRIARNTQLILQHECNLTRLIDPAGGSWYVESVTEQLASKAWDLFQQIEGAGGLLAALQAGTPQQQVHELAVQRAKNLATRKDRLVGTNMYANPYERPLAAIQPDFAALAQARAKELASQRSQGDSNARSKALETLASASGAQAVEAAIAATNAGATLGDMASAQRSDNGTAPTITPLDIKRVAEPFEELRAAADAYTERTGHRPRVFLANMGPVSQHKGRADFSTGFFEVGGFEVQTNLGFPTTDEAAQAAKASGASVVVICSTDDTYPDLVPPLVEQIKAAKPDTVVILAGYPTDQIEALKAAGVDDFVHLRANCYNVLAHVQQQIGVSAA